MLTNIVMEKPQLTAIKFEKQNGACHENVEKISDLRKLSMGMLSTSVFCCQEDLQMMEWSLADRILNTICCVDGYLSKSKAKFYTYTNGKKHEFHSRKEGEFFTGIFGTKLWTVMGD